MSFKSMFLKGFIKTRYFATESPDVILKEINKCGSIILNRPKYFNSINFNMVTLISTALRKWKSDVNINHVIVEGAGEKAFSSGGDIREVFNEFIKYPYLLHKAHYTLDYSIKNFDKPFISILNGLVMGGGLGLSVHGTYRVVTEKTLNSIPETAIGLFPDAGCSHFLSKMQNNIGMYLALVGRRLQGRDVLVVGIGTHFVSSWKINKLKKELINASNKFDIDFILNKYHEEDGEHAFGLLPFMDFIEEHFSKPCIEEILLSLSEKINSPSTSLNEREWCRKHRDILFKMCPTSLKLTFKLLNEAKNMSFQNCLITEYRLASRCLKKKNFQEGVRAFLIEKDKNPFWDPSSIDAVKDSMIDEYFTPMEQELF